MNYSNYFHTELTRIQSTSNQIYSHTHFSSTGGERKKGPIPHERRQAPTRNSACAPTSANTALTGRGVKKLQEGKNPASTPTSLNTELCMHADKREHSPEAETTSRKHTRFHTKKGRQNIRLRNNFSSICIRQIVCELESWVSAFFGIVFGPFFPICSQKFIL